MPLTQFACFACRKVFKKPPLQPAGGYPCPGCARPLTFMGSAFRAPKRSDHAQWSKAQQLLEAGFVFHPNSGPRPQTLSEVSEFLQSKARAKQSPGVRALERMAQPAPRTPGRMQGRLKRLGTEGKPRFELAGRELQAYMTVRVREGGEWLEGAFRHTGDGGKEVEPYVLVGRKRVFIGPQTVLRWPE